MPQERYVPDLVLIDITRGLLLQERSDLLQLTSSRACIVEQVAELARIGLDILDILLEPRIAFEN